PAAEGADLGLASRRRGRNLDHAIRRRLHLTGEDVAVGGLVFSQRVFDVHAHRVFSAFTMTLAGAAGAVAAIERNVDLRTVRGVGDELARVAGDHSGHTIFELQGNVVRHE